MNRRIVPILCAGFFLTAVILLFSQNIAFSAGISEPEKTLSSEQTLKVEYTAPDSDNQRAPNIDFPSTQHDFGKVSEGASPTTEFSFKNSGNETLVIKEVKGG